MGISQEVTERFYNPLTVGESGRCLKWVNPDRAGEDHSAMNFRIALKADAASVNFCALAVAA